MPIQKILCHKLLKLSVQQYLLLRGSAFVILSSPQLEILEQFYSAHQGIQKWYPKALADVVHQPLVALMPSAFLSLLRQKVGNNLFT